MKRLLFDCETDGFLANVTKVHCIAAADIDTTERFEWGPNEVPAALEVLSQADVLIGHNAMRFDVPVLQKLHSFRPWRMGTDKDTLIMARLIYPNVKDTDIRLIQSGKMPAGKDYHGKHTIAAWGYRLGIPKVGEDITDWSTWTPYMQERCVGDVETNLALLKHLRWENYSQEAILLEHRAQLVCDAIEAAGVPFNVKKAGALHADLVERAAVLKQQLVEQFGGWLQPISPNPAKYEVTPKVNNKTRGVVKGQPYCKLKWETFNPGSRDHIARVLIRRGWRPTKFTPGGKPEIDENAVEAITASFPEMAGLGELLMVQQRLSQLVEGDSALLRLTGDDGRIHGVINPMGTTTGRATHFKPNLSQVPSAKKPYGERFRDCFEAFEGWCLVGADMEGLEGRGFAHYLHPLDGGAYAKQLLSGDPHWASSKNLGFISENEVRDKENQLHVILREGAKRFYYAFIYGAQDNQCGTIILDTCNDAKKAGFPAPYTQFFGATVSTPSKTLLERVGGLARLNFTRRTPGLERLRRILDEQVHRHNRVPGLDGRKIPVRSKHSVLNFLIQSAGAIICKRWMCDAFEDLCRRYRLGWDGDFVLVLWVHDELQVACRKELAKEIGETLVKHARAAGEPYGFRVPLDSKYSVGRSWAATH